MTGCGSWGIGFACGGRPRLPRPRPRGARGAGARGGGGGASTGVAAAAKQESKGMWYWMQRPDLGKDFGKGLWEMPSLQRAACGKGAGAGLCDLATRIAQVLLNS